MATYTLLQNASTDAISLPYPMRGILPPGKSVVLGTDPATVLAALGGNPGSSIRLTELDGATSSDTFFEGSLIVPSADIPDLGVTTAKLADGAVTTVKLATGAVAPLNLAPPVGLLGAMIVMRVPITAGVGGGADDVAIYVANLPQNLRIVQVTLCVVTPAGMGATATLRTAAAGGGTAVSSALASDVATRVYGVSTSTTQCAAGSSLYLRRTDNTLAGELLCFAETY